MLTGHPNCLKEQRELAYSASRISFKIVLKKKKKSPVFPSSHSSGNSCITVMVTIQYIKSCNYAKLHEAP